MLVLARKVGETIVIGNAISVTVVSIGAESIRLGINAPPDVRIDRLEVAVRRAREEAGDDNQEP